MGKKLDKKAKAAVAKAAKGIKAEKTVKKFRKLEGKLWTREYLLKIAEFDGATIAPANGAAARADARTVDSVLQRRPRDRRRFHRLNEILNSVWQ